MSPLKLLVASEYFWPDEASTGRLLGELVGRMKEEHPDWQIDVFTSHRLYRTTSPKPLLREESWKGIRIHRLRSLRSGKDSVWRRAVSDVVFSFKVWLRTARKSSSVILAVTNPPLLPLMLVLFPKRHSVPVLYLIHDLYPDVPIALGLWKPSSIFARVLRAAQRLALHRAALVIVLGETMRDHLVRAYGVNPERIGVIPNWATVEARGPGNERGGKEPFYVVYSGNIGQLHDFDTVLHAAELLRDRPVIQFRIVGDGPKADWLRSEVSRRGLHNVSINSFLPDAQFAELLQRSSLGVITFEPGMECLGVPSKTYNLLAFGIPLIAVTGPESEVARIIRDHGVGYCVSHGDAASFAKSVLRAYENQEEWKAMSEKARRYAEQFGGLDRAVRQYADAIMRVAATLGAEGGRRRFRCHRDRQGRYQMF